MNVKAGDIIAVESQGFVAWTIRRVQKRLGYTAQELLSTHIAVCINSYGDILEAEGDGIRLANIRYYDIKGWKYHVLRHKEANGKDIANMAMRLCFSPKFLKRKYDFSLIVGLYLFSIGFNVDIAKYNSVDRYICSEFALEILVALGIIVPREDKVYFPAEWMRWKNEGFFTEIEQKMDCYDL